MPPLVLVSGPERVLAERAIDSTLDLCRQADPEVEIVRLEGSAYEAGLLAQHSSPSLFGGARVIVIRGLDEATDDLVNDLSAYLSSPPDADDGVTLVVWHKGGNRAKKVLDALKKAKARQLSAPAVKSDRDKSDFVTSEFRRAGRRLDPEAVRALVEAVGKDVAELAAACRQLIADTTGTVDAGTVETYYGGRVTANGFRVADATLAGNTTEALAMVRHAVAVGTDPVPIVAALAAQLRQLVKVMGAPSGSGGQVAGALGMAPWQVDRARRALRGWSDEGLAAAISAVAQADFDVKGGGRDPVYAVEKCVLEVTRARRTHAPTSARRR
ncbi:MAG: DNA polymerase III subunit delta [Dermatophilus congolensis]|nr:DNA polymerase III subunit delta [Dermatophilus congolensis]